MSDDDVVNFAGIKELGIPYCRSQIMRLVATREFPRAFKLGPHRSSPLVWWRREIVEWLQAKANQPSAPQGA
jgi:predicted DNA-binding transcriptional regulator AlpA